MALLSVIKYNGGPNVFAWKYPDEEIGTWSQLIVNETQEAVLFKGGKALDLFSSGRHQLSTENIPILRDIIKFPFGGRSPFSAEVWFVNKTFVLDIRWGTTTPIQLEDPQYHIFLPVRAFGQFGIKIVDSRSFLEKLVGTVPVFNQENLSSFFRGLYLTKVKDIISSYIIKREISLLKINAYIDELSEQLKNNISPTFAEYGISLTSFYVNDISTPENDSAVMQLKSAMSKRAEMNIVGFNYTQERSFDTLEKAASNESGGQGGLMGIGMGLGMGVGLGAPLGEQMGAVAEGLRVSSPKKCPKCQAEIDANQRYCSVCGADVQEKLPTKIHCPYCGSEVANASKYCPECGKALLSECPNCHVKLKPGTKFCPECGTKL